MWRSKFLIKSDMGHKKKTITKWAVTQQKIIWAHVEPYIY